jgi:2-polyprenyl-3-methyl-5-hydroxy-6-metoxy-1,4-benzoquinol methylase
MKILKSKTKSAFPVCSLCDGQTKKQVLKNIIKYGKKYNIFECSSCRIWITSPNPSIEELSILYSTGNYRAKTGKRFVPLLEMVIYFLTVRKRNRIKGYVSEGRILDIGCGRGLFLNLMKKDGWLVTGHEFDGKSASYAKNNYEIDVHTGDLKGQFEKESFDVININHVLEHMKKPGETLLECNRILKKGGLLVVAVPNIDSLQAKFGKKIWFQLDIPFHLYHFSSKGLVDLIKSKMFHVDLIRHFKFEYNPFGWLQTMLNVSGVRENHLYDLLKSSELKDKVNKYFPSIDAVKSLLLIPLYLPLSIIFSTIETLLRKGGTVEIYSLKK